LSELAAARTAVQKGFSTHALAERLRVEPNELRQVIEVLLKLDWVGRLTEESDPSDQGQARHVLLIDPEQTSVAPLADRLLVLRETAADPVWVHMGLDTLRVSALLTPPTQ
jgi:membrane protein